MKNWEKLANKQIPFDKFFVKEAVIKASRKFFEEKGYHELESPILSKFLPVERHLNPLNVKLNEKESAYMIPSTETFNKKILAAGIGNHFVVSKVFRGLSDTSSKHLPEFTMLEWYSLDKSYIDLMDEAENLVKYIDKFLFDSKLISSLKFENTKWARYSVDELFQKYLKKTIFDYVEEADLRSLAEEIKLNVSEEDDYEIIFELIFANFIEPNLNVEESFFIYDYPYHLCPLAKPNEKKSGISEKVEMYIRGMELANGYTELRDSAILKENFDREQETRKRIGKEPIRMDEDLVRAVSRMPPVAGIGLGIDRLAMIFAEAKSINEINYFPYSDE